MYRSQDIWAIFQQFRRDLKLKPDLQPSILVLVFTQSHICLQIAWGSTFPITISTCRSRLIRKALEPESQPERGRARNDSEARKRCIKTKWTHVHYVVSRDRIIPTVCGNGEKNKMIRTPSIPRVLFGCFQNFKSLQDFLLHRVLDIYTKY